MMQGPIQRMVRERVESRADVRLPMAWVGEPRDLPVWTGGDWLTRTPGRLAVGGEAPILALLGNRSEDARAALLAHAGTGARVYALVGPGWGTDPADNEVLRAPRVLVRRLPETPATAVHAGTEARLWIGGDFILRLEPTQVEALRQTFLRLFWHEATDEAWSGGLQFVWRPARERPFDVPQLAVSAPLRMEPPDARLTGMTRAGLTHISAGLPPATASQRLWFPAGPDHQERLAKLAVDGVDVVWTDRGLPDLQVDGNTGEILLPGTRGRLRVRLSMAQTADVQSLLEASPQWRFRVDARLGEVPHRTAQVWLPGEGAPRELEDEQFIDVPEAAKAAELREMQEAVPSPLPGAQPLALSARYRWAVDPPRMPKGAGEDAVVARWRKLDEAWEQQIGRIRQGLGGAEEDRGRMGRTFAGLVGAMLGFERRQTELLAQLGRLAERRPSEAGPSAAQILLNELSETEDAVQQLRASQGDAERKARDDEERARQHAAWRGRVDSASEKRSDCRGALDAAERRLASMTAELREIEDALASADDMSRKDLIARKRRASDDEHRATKDIGRLRGELVSLEEDADEPFEFRPTSSPAGPRETAHARFVPSTKGAPAIQIPEEAHPEVGSLRQLKGQRYLVITTWEQLAEGERVAARLSAKLVAQEIA